MKKTKIEVCTRTGTAAVADWREKRILAVKAAIELRVAMGMPMALDDLKRKYPDVYDFVFDY